MVMVYALTVLQVSGCYYKKSTACKEKAVVIGDTILQNGPDDPSLDSLMHKRLVLLLEGDRYYRKAQKWAAILFLDEK